MRDKEKEPEIALQNFFGIVSKWDLTDSEAKLLAGWPNQGSSILGKTSGAKTITEDTLTRISLVMGIYKATHILVPEPTRANSWIRRANSAFYGSTPLEIMLSGDLADLFRIRRHLDGALA